MKYIAWLNRTSVAIGSKSEVRTKALNIFASAAWQRTHSGITTLEITTYGTQRLVSTEELQAYETK